MSRPAFATVMCVVVVFLLAWPFLSSAQAWSGLDTYIFLFAVWAAVIAIIILISRKIPPLDDRERPRD